MDFNEALAGKLNADYWQMNSLDALKRRQRQLKDSGHEGITKSKKARNVILFIGDGLGMTGITATRKFKEQSSKKPFYENGLVWDSFPYSAFSKVCLNYLLYFSPYIILF